jgi:N-acetylmuramoyl-L-alanine amidase
MTDGERMLKLAESRIGEKYVNVCVPKNNENWHGPWDCAEFMSWLLYQIGGFLYGCVNDNGDPATVEAYTGAWQTDSRRLGRRVPTAKAASTVGAILLRYPPAPGAMGHIVVSDGNGGTVEAIGKAYSVRRGKLSGRVWNTGVFLPNFSYGDETNTVTTGSHLRRRAPGHEILGGEGDQARAQGVRYRPRADQR